ncbi:hypothetical protein PoB_001922900 [Plakobranchus ocellatus]|uniref:Uncharacterized protein n=1 Tax=Plakobranchus ocellatus TaxID=259542 RepID=A0AAV3ZFQ5_9GAST|nr:hypothetical protein PoB_001922900 [Plakobranchus ocellatus]
MEGKGRESREKEREEEGWREGVRARWRARTRDGRVPADLRADSLAAMPPTPQTKWGKLNSIVNSNSKNSKV